MEQNWSLTFSSQVDAVVDGRLRRVGVHDDVSVQRDVKRSVDGGPVSAHDVQTFVDPVPPETHPDVNSSL